MRLSRVRFFGGVLAALLIVPAPLPAAFIDPADGSGSFGSDPNTWALNLPASINTNSATSFNFTDSNSVTKTYATTATIRTTTPWTRGSANTTYQGWDRFSSVSLANSPNTSASPNEVDANAINPNGTATLTQLTSGGPFLTSGFNIYSPSTASSFSLVVPHADPGSGFQTNYLIQLRASTGEFDFASFAINGIPLTSLPNYSQQLLNAVITMAGPSSSIAADYKIEFSLPGSSTLDTITFASAGIGLGLDKLSVDTSVSAIPEPSSIAFVGLCGVSGLLVLRRRQHRG